MVIGCSEGGSDVGSDCGGAGVVVDMVIMETL